MKRSLSLLSLISCLVVLGCSPKMTTEPEVVSSAQYKVTFTSAWSASTHPNQFPPLPHFSSLIGATHNSSVSFWKAGQIASEGIRLMAELGSITPLDTEINQAIAASTAEFILSGGGIFPSPGSVELTFAISSEKPLVSLVSMIAPSPDWFVGVHDLNLFPGAQWQDTMVVDLYPYDAGTDDGPTYLSSDDVTTPSGSIARVIGDPLLVSGTVPPLGTFTFVRINQ